MTPLSNVIALRYIIKESSKYIKGSLAFDYEIKFLESCKSDCVWLQIHHLIFEQINDA